MLFRSPFNVHAEENRVPDLSENGLTLTVNFSQDKEDGDKLPIDGAEFRIFKVASLSVNGGSADYVTEPPYASLAEYDEGRDITFNGMSGSDSGEKAREFSLLDNSAYNSGITDSNGSCSFTQLEAGIYLVIENAKSGTAAEYETVAPFFACVPYAHEDEGYVWIYDVEVEPKTEVLKIETAPAETTSEKETESDDLLSMLTGAKTGDQSRLIIYSVGGIVALIIGCVCIFIRRKGEKK